MSQASSDDRQILITGGTGFVGQKLMRHIERPWVVTRNASRAQRQLGFSDSQVLEWNSDEGPIRIPEGRRLRGVVNLMGESVAEGRWTTEKKKRIRDSRVRGTELLVEGIVRSGSLPDVFVSASAVGYYGDRGEETLDENSPPGSGFLTDVCLEWEQAALKMAEHGVRVCLIRVGMVLGMEGGALQKLVPLFRWGLGGRLGSGRQWFPWIHVDDLTRMIAWAVDQPVSGPFNATAPNPVRNSKFTQQLAAAVHRPAILPAPAFALRLGLGEFGGTLLFSQRVLPRAATDAGFQFEHPELAGALHHLLG